MKAADGGRSAANPQSRRNPPQKDDAERESYAGARNPAWEAGGAAMPPGKPGKASRTPESAAADANEPRERLLGRILDGDGMNAAFKRAESNKGAGGADKMQEDGLFSHLVKCGEAVKRAIMEGKCKPNPAGRAGMPKGGGKRRPLGMPAATGRAMRQSTAKASSPIFVRQLSDGSLLIFARFVGWKTYGDPADFQSFSMQYICSTVQWHLL
ncbi:MAG: hypothetical protein LBU32_20250 [Clostridiales bacterium]|jgi:hypothetical protein|nr:hypothetical protein [Clostridiales bacterium]